MDNIKSTSSSAVYSRLLAFQFNDASLATAQCARWKTCPKWASDIFFLFSLFSFFVPSLFSNLTRSTWDPALALLSPRCALIAFLFLALCLISPLGHCWSRPPVFCGGSFHCSILTHLWRADVEKGAAAKPLHINWTIIIRICPQPPIWVPRMNWGCLPIVPSLTRHWLGCTVPFFSLFFFSCLPLWPVILTVWMPFLILFFFFCFLFSFSCFSFLSCIWPNLNRHVS